MKEMTREYKMESTADEDYHAKVMEFPSAFNLVTNEHVTTDRLKAALNNLLPEMDSESSNMERIRNTNLLTWIYFRLGKHDKAVELSNKAINLTNLRNIASLGHRFFLMWKTGNELAAIQCLEMLENITKEENFRELITEANAEQAYYYSRLGGPENLKLAISLFSEAVTEIPDNYLWKFGLGLVYRRATHGNIFCSSTDRMDVDKCKKMAVTYLFEVAENSNSRLQAMAYAQLVKLRQNQPPECDPEFDVLFRHLSVRQLCEKALQIGYDIPSVLTHCGKVMTAFNIDESIRLLEKSVTIKKNSVAYHYLGKSYVLKAKELQEENALSHSTEALKSVSYISESWNLKDNKSTDDHEKSRTNLLLNKDDELVIKAVGCFKQAIEIAKENFPAILDLGILLKETGQVEEALTQFNRVTNSNISSRTNKLTAISANEQAGLCYLELSKMTESDRKCEELGKKKLTTAVSLAADPAVIMPELKENVQELWTAYRMLENKIDKESPSPNQQKKMIKLLELARNYGQIIDVLQKLREFSEDELCDPNIIMVALKSYLNLKQPENALAFQNLVGIKPDVRDSAWWRSGPLYDQRMRVLLQAIYGRLRDSTEDSTALFQQLFKLSVGTCVGVRAHEKNPAENVIGDVLVVYDGDYDSEEDPSLTMKSARCLKEVATWLFGLAAEENLKGCGEFGDYQAEIQLKLMKKYRVVVIVLGNEKRNGVFDAILRCMSHCMNPTDHRIVIINTGLQENEIPLCLTQYECYQLEDSGGLKDICTFSEGTDDDGPLSYLDILDHVFHGDVDTILKLFCFLIGQQRQCP